MVPSSARTRVTGARDLSMARMSKAGRNKIAVDKYPKGNHSQCVCYQSLAEFLGNDYSHNHSY